MIEWAYDTGDAAASDAQRCAHCAALRRPKPEWCGRLVGRDPRHRTSPRRPAVWNPAQVVHGLVCAAGQHDRRLHRSHCDRAGTRVLARPARDGDRHRARVTRRRISVDVGSAHRRRAAAGLPHGLRGRRRAARGVAVVVVDRVGRTGGPVRWRGPRATARHPVLGRRADRPRRSGSRGLFRLRGHSSSPGRAHGRAVRDVRRVRGEARRRPRRRDATDAAGRRPRRQLRAHGHDLVQSGGFVGELCVRLQPIPAGAVVEGERVRVYVRRHSHRLRLRAGHRRRGRRTGVRTDRRGRAIGHGRRIPRRVGVADHRLGVDRFGSNERLQRVVGARRPLECGCVARCRRLW